MKVAFEDFGTHHQADEWAVNVALLLKEDFNFASFEQATGAKIDVISKHFRVFRFPDGSFLPLYWSDNDREWRIWHTLYMPWQANDWLSLTEEEKAKRIKD